MIKPIVFFVLNNSYALIFWPFDVYKFCDGCFGYIAKPDGICNSFVNSANSNESLMQYTLSRLYAVPSIFEIIVSSLLVGLCIQAIMRLIGIGRALQNSYTTTIYCKKSLFFL